MRSKETIQQELTETRTRLSAYLAREADMLSKDGVQLYTIGSRNLQRYQTSLASVQDMIAKLQKRVRELEAELAGGVEARAEALLDPVIVSIPPGNDFWRIVFPESLLLTSETFALSTLLSRIIGAIRRRENFRASSREGWTNRIEPGSWSIM